jgi:hypothetical protein
VNNYNAIHFSCNLHGLNCPICDYWACTPYTFCSKVSNLSLDYCQLNLIRSQMWMKWWSKNSWGSFWFHAIHMVNFICHILIIHGIVMVLYYHSFGLHCFHAQFVLHFNGYMIHQSLPNKLFNEWTIHDHMSLLLVMIWYGPWSTIYTINS